MKNQAPRVSLDDFPVRADVSDDPRSVEKLIGALARALSLPKGWKLQAAGMGWSSRGGRKGPLAGGLRVVAIKRHAKGHDLVLASHVAFHGTKLVAWSADLDLDVPSRPMQLEVHDAHGARAVLSAASRERAAKLGLDAAKARAKRVAAAPRILVAEAPLWAVSLSPDGARCASVDQKQVLSLWDTATGERLQHRSIAGARAIVSAVAHSHDGTRIASGVRPLHVVDAASLASVLALEVPNGGGVRAAAWSPDDRFVAAAIGGVRRGNVAVWDARTGKLVRRADHRNPWKVAFAPDGESIVAGGYGPTLRIALDGEVLAETESPAPHSLVAVGGGWAVGPEKGAVLRWDADLASVGTLPIAGVTRGARLAADRAGRTLVAGAWAGEEIVWVDLARGKARARAALPVVDGVAPSLQSVAITPDGKTTAATAGWSVALYDDRGKLRLAPRAG